MKESAAIKAACQSSSGVCPSHSNWPNATRTAIQIKQPLSTMPPVLVISMPRTIGACDSLSLDLTASTGNGGRDWSSSSAQAFSSCQNVSQLNTFLNESLTVFHPTIIPAIYFSSGCTYSFNIMLCNFIGACSSLSQSVVAVDSVIPNVAIPGGTLQTITTKSILTLASITSVSSCPGDKSIRTLSYQWVISQNNIQLISMKSISKDPSKYILPPYSLIPNTYYKVQLTVSIKETLMSSSVFTTVYVAVGKLVAVINGGLSKNMRVLSSLVVDASQSYDEDQSGLTGTKAGLQFSWTCSQISPVFNESCQNTLIIFANSSVAKVSALSTLFDTVSQLTVTISDSSGSRYTKSIVSIKVLPNSAAILGTNSNIPTGVMNPSQSLQLTGSVIVPQVLLQNNSYIRWTVSDGDIDLDSIALSAVQQEVKSLSFTTYLVLPPFSLTGGSSLTFSLTCCSLIGVPLYISTLSLIINSPPRLGKISVSPKIGVELVDNFVFSASQWTSSNYPLYYQFGYLSTIDVSVIVQSKSLRSFGKVILPGGIEANNFTLITIVNIFDSLNANSSAIFSIIVKKTLVAVSSEQLFTIVGSSSAASIDHIKQANGLVSTILNTVNCSVAPNCSALNRQPCAKTPNTCGGCLSDIFVGDSGDSNTFCVPIRQYNSTLSSTCAKTGQPCGGSGLCLAGKCMVPSKRCPSDCSGHGQCGYFNADSGSLLSTCRVGDSRCVAQCICDAEYANSLLCNMNSTEHDKRKTIRAQLLSNVAHLIENEYPDQESVSGWTSSLTVAIQNSDELNSSATSQIYNMTAAIFSKASQLNMDSSAILGVLPIINSALNIPRSNESAQPDLLSLLQHAGAVVSANMLPGQHPVQSVQSQFRLSTSVLTYENAFRSNLSIPQNSLELAAGIVTSKVSFLEDSESTAEPERDTIQVTVVSIRSKLAPPLQNRQYQSNPLAITLSTLPCSSNSSSCAINFFLTNSDASIVPTIKKVSNATEFITLLCKKGQFSRTSHNCSSGYILEARCNGTFTGILKSFCPVVHYKTVCSSFLTEGVGLEDCKTIARNAEGTACRCLFRPSISHRSLQQSQGGQRIGAVALLESTTDNMKDTIYSAASLNAEEIQREVTVLVTIGTLAVTIILALLAAYQWDVIDLEREEIKHTSLFNDKKVLKRSSLISRSVKQIAVYNRMRVRRLNSRLEEKGRDDLPLLEESLPEIYSSKPFAERLSSELKHYHKWFGVGFHYSESFPRPLRVLALTTKILMMLFFQSLTYDFTSPDDGSCEALKSQSDCLREQSPFGTGQSKCSWSTSDNECSFVQPSDSFAIVLYVAIFSTLVSTPIELILNIIIVSVLARPLKRTSSVEPVINEKVAGIRDLRNDSERSSEELSTMNHLCFKIKEYRKTLEPAARQEFDLLWGLNSEGTFGTAGEGKKSWFDIKKTVDVRAMILADLIAVTSSTEREKELLRSFASKKHVQKRLLYLFHRDLLPGITGRILESKAERDSEKKGQSVSLLGKVIGYFFIYACNAGMLFYIFLFALRQTKYRQNAWFRSFMTWLGLDIVLVCSAVVIITQIVIPSLVMKDLSRIKERLLSNIYDLKQKIDDNNGCGFNCADYLFVSTRIAKMDEFKDLKVAQMIADFRTPWPRRSYQRVNEYSRTYRSSFAALFSGFGNVFMFLVGSFFQFPSSAQDAFFYSFLSVGFGYVVLLLTELYNLYPALIAIPVASAIVLIHFIVRAITSATKKSKMNIRVVNSGAYSSAHHSEAINQNRRASIAQGVEYVQSMQENLMNEAISDSGFDSNISDYHESYESRSASLISSKSMSSIDFNVSFSFGTSTDSCNYSTNGSSEHPTSFYSEEKMDQEGVEECDAPEGEDTNESQEGDVMHRWNDGGDESEEEYDDIHENHSNESIVERLTTMIANSMKLIRNTQLSAQGDPDEEDYDSNMEQ